MGLQSVVTLLDADEEIPKEGKGVSHTKKQQYALLSSGQFMPYVRNGLQSMTFGVCLFMTYVRNGEGYGGRREKTRHVGMRPEYRAAYPRALFFRAVLP